MTRISLITAAVLATTFAATAQAADVQANATVSAPGVNVNAGASANTALDLKASKEAAAKAAASSRDAAISAGVGAMVSGKSSAEAAKTASAAATTEAKAAAEKAQADATARMGTTQATVAGYKQTAEQKIALKDRVALGKHFGVSKATNKAFGAIFGASANSNDLPKGYEKQLVIGAKLDAKLATKATAIDASLVKELSAQPKGTELVKVGDRVVRLDSKTRIVLDVASI